MNQGVLSKSKNRKQQLKSSLKHDKQKQQTHDEFIAIFNALENVNIFQTISAIKLAYFLFLYNNRQISDINKEVCFSRKLEFIVRRIFWLL